MSMSNIMKKGIYNIIGSILLIGVMFFVVSQFKKLGLMFYEARVSEAQQISELVKENYEGIETLSSMQKNNIIDLYTDKELIGVDVRAQTGIMVSSTYFILGSMAIYYFFLGIYQIYRHKKSSKGTPKSGAPS